MNATMMLPVVQLKTYQLQADFYDTCSQADDEVLAADLRQNGQRDPIEVMPPDNAAGLAAYTILDGHRRVHLLQQLGHSEVRVHVRDDLKDADAATVEAAFLTYNFARRQLHPIDTIRIAKRQYELKTGRRTERYGSAEREARDHIGKLIGMSGRNLNRYWALLYTPLAVQRAVRDGRLTLVLGAKVAGLPERTQAEVARQIELATAKKVNAIVEPYFATQKNSRQTIIRFIRLLDREGQELREIIDQIPPRLLVANLPVLQSAHILLGDLIQIAENAPEPASIEDVATELVSLDFGIRS